MSMHREECARIYCTVSLMTAVWLKLPEVAVTVMEYVPAVVPGCPPPVPVPVSVAVPFPLKPPPHDDISPADASTANTASHGRIRPHFLRLKLPATKIIPKGAASASAKIFEPWAGTNPATEAVVVIVSTAVAPELPCAAREGMTVAGVKEQVLRLGRPEQTFEKVI